MRKRSAFARFISLGGAFLAAVSPIAVGAQPAQAQGLVQLTAVRTGAHPGYDRLVFQFDHALPSVRAVVWVPKVVADPSGKVLALEGRAFLRVVFRPAAAHTQAGRPSYAGTLPNHPGLPVLRSVRLAGDFEGVLSFGLGLTHKAPLHIFSLSAPPRLVVDISDPA